jgi:hypothetical protein
MPRRKPSFNRTDVKAAWDLHEKCGHEPMYVKYHPDGSFRVITRKHLEFTGQKISSGGNGAKTEWDVALGT